MELVVAIQVRGHMAALSDGKVQVTLPIGDDSSVSDVHRMCTSDSSACTRPRAACTDVILLERGYYHDEPASKLLLIPHTGTLHTGLVAVNQWRIHGVRWVRTNPPPSRIPSL